MRGDEVVSLGWCFWHRVCFGCLVCGSALSVPKGVDGSGVIGGNGMVEKSGGGLVGDVMGNKGQWGHWEDGRNQKRGKGRCTGVELEDVPLCKVCSVETAGKSPGQVLQRSVELVSSFDGGISRDRLKMLSGDGDDLRVDGRRRLQSQQRSKARIFDGPSVMSSRETVIVHPR